MNLLQSHSNVLECLTNGCGIATKDCEFVEVRLI